MTSQQERTVLQAQITAAQAGLARLDADDRAVAAYATYAAASGDDPDGCNLSDHAPDKKLEKWDRELFGRTPVQDVEGRPSERGSGSAYSQMLPTDRAHYDALEALVKALRIARAADVEHGVCQSNFADAQSKGAA